MTVTNGKRYYRLVVVMLKTMILGYLTLGIYEHVLAFGEPPKEPILRVETGMHTINISSMATDANERILATASRDKTVRIWDLKSGLLLKVLRVPINVSSLQKLTALTKSGKQVPIDKRSQILLEMGRPQASTSGEKEGSLYAVAVSPDGKTVAAGGRTGEDWDALECIYLIDIENGKIIRRLTGITSPIDHLSFSKDGRYLAAAVNKSALVFDTSTWALKATLGTQLLMEFPIGRVFFDKDGRLATFSLEGVQLYDGNFRLIAKKQMSEKEVDIRSAAISPDGQKIAVYHSNTNKLEVLSGKDLSSLYSPDVSGAIYISDWSLAWSANGGTLFAYALKKQHELSAIRAWALAGKGTFKEFDLSGIRIDKILPLASGNIVYSTIGIPGPSIGMLDSNGKKVLTLSSTIPNYESNSLLISKDGSVVRFGFHDGEKRGAIFSVSSRSFSELSSETEGITDLHAPVTDINGTPVKDFLRQSLKNQPAHLGFGISQFMLAVAASRDGNALVQARPSEIVCSDRRGELKWEISTPANPWSVNVSGDGKVLVAALCDGTFRWYRMEDGQELLVLFPHKDGKRWVMWTSSGYYACSPGADELIGWHVNNGKDKSPDFFPASRFRSVYYRPDVTEKILSTLDEKKALILADKESVRKHQEPAIDKMLPPVVSIQSPKDRGEVSTTEVKVRYEVRSPSGEPISGVKALVDGRPVLDLRRASKEQAYNPKQGGAAEISVSIPENDCEISIIAENRYSASVPATVQVRWTGKRGIGVVKNATPEEPVGKPKLYLLAVGIGQYQKTVLRLAYPAKDARDFVGVLLRQKDKLYRDVVSKVLTDGEATQGGVLKGLEWIEREVTSKDIAMVFLAGHAMNDQNGDYHFLPRDADTQSLKSTAIPYSTIKDTITRMPGKVLLFVDTCHSGDVMGYRRRGGSADIDKIVNDLVAAENGIVVFASSSGTQYSFENDKWQNGAFTKALVEGLSGKAADFDKTGRSKITIDMLSLYLTARVKELTEGVQTPTTAKPQTIRDFPIAVR